MICKELPNLENKNILDNSAVQEYQAHYPC